MDQQKKVKLLERLVQQGTITLEEALGLMEKEKEYIYPSFYSPYTPYVGPNWIQPNDIPSYIVTCDTKVSDLMIKL